MAEINPFLIERLCRKESVPVCVYHRGESVLQIPKREAADSIFEYDKELLASIIKAVDENDKPIIYMEEIYVFFGAFKDAKEHYFIWGPISREEMSAQKLVSYYHKHHYEGKRHPIIKLSLELLSSILSIAYYGYCGKCVVEEDIFVEWQEKGDFMQSAEMEHYQLDKSELNRTHNSIEYENKLVEAIESGGAGRDEPGGGL